MVTSLGSSEVPMGAGSTYLRVVRSNVKEKESVSVSAFALALVIQSEMRDTLQLV